MQLDDKIADQFWIDLGLYDRIRFLESQLIQMLFSHEASKVRFGHKRGGK